VSGPHLGDDSYFLATYGDGVTDAPLDEKIATLERRGKTGLLISVKPRLEYHLVHSNPDGVVTAIEQLAQADVRINGGFFVF
jgi:glucose-1-phosphate cytidylyltransferase